MSGPKRKEVTPPVSSKTKAPVGEGKPPVQFLPPLKPRPKLVVILGILVVVWLVVLVVVRFTTVHR